MTILGSNGISEAQVQAISDQQKDDLNIEHNTTQADIAAMVIKVNDLQADMDVVKSSSEAIVFTSVSPEILDIDGTAGSQNAQIGNFSQPITIVGSNIPVDIDYVFIQTGYQPPSTVEWNVSPPYKKAGSIMRVTSVASTSIVLSHIGAVTAQGGQLGTLNDYGTNVVGFMPLLYVRGAGLCPTNLGIEAWIRGLNWQPTGLSLERNFTG